MSVGASGTEFLTYNLYQDEALSQVWKTGAEALNIPSTVNGGPQDITVYGKVFEGQSVSEGVYTDTVDVTIVVN